MMARPSVKMKTQQHGKKENDILKKRVLKQNRGQKEKKKETIRLSETCNQVE